jgi:hypothetical protein
MVAAGAARPDRRRLLCTLFVIAFAIHALNYAYFFVDDEAIPFVYAQHLIDGHGLVYNPDDGPVEGYSDFLSVWLDTGILGLVTVLGGGRLRALMLGKVIALACAVGIVVVTFALLVRQLRVRTGAVVAGMSFLVLAGPLAVWSWSALETTLFGLTIAVLLWSLFESDAGSVRNDRLMLVSTVTAVLARIDGFVWTTALLLPFVVRSSASRRRQMAVRVLLPALAVFVVYHVWRVWYFRELLPMPLYAKVLYKLGPHERLVANEPSQSYALAFLSSYFWLPVLAVAAGLASTGDRARVLRPLTVGVIWIFTYLWIVGDWMFGFRFFVPLLPAIAVLVAGGADELTRWRPRFAPALVLVWIALLAVIAFRFERRYEAAVARKSWLTSASLDPARFFAPYYEIYLRALAYAGTGDTIAYNQAGFVPFMLNARNVDDLGICTKFYAKLPTTDVVFTEVGRYSPLTEREALRASEMYTVSRAPRLLLEPGGNLRAANRGKVPPTVLGGAYRLLFSTETVDAYEPAAAIDRHPSAREYLENLAHISHLRRASVNGRVVPIEAYRTQLAYLAGGRGQVEVDASDDAEFIFSGSDEDAYQLFIGSARSADGGSLVLLLRNTQGATVRRDEMQLAPNTSATLHISFDAPVRASALSLVFKPSSPGAQTVELDDVRVQGHTPALRRFLQERHVAFD